MAIFTIIIFGLAVIRTLVSFVKDFGFSSFLIFVTMLIAYIWFLELLIS